MEKKDLTKLRTIHAYFDFPKIFREPKQSIRLGSDKPTRLLTIVFRDHVEMYKMTGSYYDCDGQKLDPYKEEEMAIGGGMKRVHGNKEVKRVSLVTYPEVAAKRIFERLKAEGAALNPSALKTITEILEIA